MTRLETYNSLIAEVERDTALVGLPALEGSLYENLESEGIPPKPTRHTRNGDSPLRL